MTDMKGTRIKRIAFILVTAYVTITASLLITVFHTETRLSTYTPPLEVRDAMYDGETDILPVGNLIGEPLDEEIDYEESTENSPEWDSELDYWGESDSYSEEELHFWGEESSEFLDADYFKFAGVIYDGDTKYTWYSQNVLPGGGLDIPGRHTDMGFVMDEQDRIVVASTDYPPGTEIDLPFGYGKGIVLDTGYLESGQIDVYTDF